MRLRLLALAFCLAAPAAHAQVALLPYAGYDFDAENLLIGAGVEVSLPVAAPVGLSVRPSGEIVLSKDIDIAGRTFTQSIGQANLDVVAKLGAPGIQPYVGAGLAVRVVVLDTSDDDAVEGDQGVEEANVGANLLGGVLFGGFGPVRPFVQARLTVSDGGAFAVLAGLSIGL
jgi:hypothetical protein